MMLNLRQHLFLSVAVPLTLGLIFCVLTAIIPLYSSMNDWHHKSSDAIQNMSLAASTTRLSKMNENLDVLYDQLVHDLATLRNTTYQHLQHQQPITKYYRPYYAHPTIDQLPVPTEDTFLGTYPTYSGLWLRGTTDYNLFVANTPLVNETSMIDPIFRAMYKANRGSVSAGTTLYFKLMIGLESGLYRRYPYSQWPDAYFTSSDYCVDTPAYAVPVGYDPRCRPWYRQSADLALSNSAGPTTVVFSKPYIDAASNAATISASSPIFTPGTSALLGVVNVDFNMAVVDSTVLQTQIGHTGYFFLMDSAGGLIAHPKWDRKAVPLQSVHVIEERLEGIWIPMFREGVENWLTKNNELVLSPYTQMSLTASPAYLLAVDDLYVGLTVNFNSGYILVMILPASDLQEDDHAAYSSLKAILDPGTAGLIVVLVFLLVLLLLGTHYIARYYSRALKDAALILEQAVKPDVKVQMQMREPVCYELNLLFKQFEPMFVAIRFGNNSFYDGNLEKALVDYDMAEQMMLRMQNEVGLAKVYNNKGNVHLKQGNFPQAEHFYNKAISMAAKLLAKTEEELQIVNAQLASLMQADGGSGGGAIEMGSIHSSSVPGGARIVQVGGSSRVLGGKSASSRSLSGPEQEAALMLEKRRLQHQRLVQLIQLAKRESNLGVLYKNQDRRKQAYQQLQQSMEHHQAADDDLGMARVASNLAQFYLEDNRLKEAETLIQETYAKLSAQNQDHTPDPISLQYATMTLGLLCAEQNKLEDACGWLQYTLQLQDLHSGIIDSSVQQTCFIKLEQIFKQLRNENMAQKYRKLHNHQATLKNVLFSLDCSGSMAGGSIVRCRDSIKEIIGQHIEPEDRVGLITFNSKSQIIIPLSQRGSDAQALGQFHHTIDNRTYPTGHTALWDAILGALLEFDRISKAAEKAGDVSESKRNNWCIVLTDGEDNASQTTPEMVRRQLVLTPVHLIVITVGNSYDKAHIGGLISAVKENSKGSPKKYQAHHIQVGSDKIASAFHTVAKMITAQLNVESI